MAETYGSAVDNMDKTTNYNMGFKKENDNNTVTANVFFNNYRHEPIKLIPNAPQFSAAGGNVGIESRQGHSARLGADHISGFGNRVTGSASLNLLNTPQHKVDVHGFSTTNIPKGPTLTFQTHGGGVDYQLRDKFSAGASVAHTPIFKQTEYSIHSGVNLHQSPSSSLQLNMGATRTDIMSRQGQWQPGTSLIFNKRF